MSDGTKLAERVLEMANAIRSGEVDPLEYRLTDAYKELKEMAAGVDSRLDIDEMLNEILGAKVNRIQELARILAAPELYVEKIKSIPVRRLAKMMSWHQSITFQTLKSDTLNDSLTRVVNLMDAMAREKPEDEVPMMSGVPNDFALESEDSLFQEDIQRFLDEIPDSKHIPFAELIYSKDEDVLLKNFLYAVVLISQGNLQYDSLTKEVWKKG
jgi:hypothetical protein